MQTGPEARTGRDVQTGPEGRARRGEQEARASGMARTGRLAVRGGRVQQPAIPARSAAVERSDPAWGQGEDSSAAADGLDCEGGGSDGAVRVNWARGGIGGTADGGSGGTVLANWAGGTSEDGSGATGAPN